MSILIITIASIGVVVGAAVSYLVGYVIGYGHGVESEEQANNERFH